MGPMGPPGKSFWETECPARGGLTHAHWSQCDPSSVHPHDSSGNEGTQHPGNMCCHCQMTHAMVEAAKSQVEGPATVVSSAPIEEHEYMMTITGRCQRCSRSKYEHIVLRHDAPPEECKADHKLLANASLAIGDGGLTWKPCVLCKVPLEPKLATGEPQGGKDGIGRGWVSPRMKSRWVTIANKHKMFEIAP